jgi:hypothetical protein
VAKEKLDLLQLTTRQVAEAGACAPQIVRRKIVDSGLYRCRFHNVPDRLRRYCLAPNGIEPVNPTFAVRPGIRLKTEPVAG